MVTTASRVPGSVDRERNRPLTAFGAASWGGKQERHGEEAHTPGRRGLVTARGRSDPNSEGAGQRPSQGLGLTAVLPDWSAVLGLFRREGEDGSRTRIEAARARFLAGPVQPLR